MKNMKNGTAFHVFGDFSRFLLSTCAACLHFACLHGIAHQIIFPDAETENEIMRNVSVDGVNTPNSIPARQVS